MTTTTTQLELREPEHKALGQIEIKDAERLEIDADFEEAKGAGRSLVRLATLAADRKSGPIDRDGDKIMTGSLDNDPTAFDVTVSGWDHDSVIARAEPVGKARVFERDGALWAEVIWDDTAPGRAAFDRVKRQKPDWSEWYKVLTLDTPNAAERAEGGKRVILKWRIVEVSPVSQGAGVATGTFESCSGECELAGAKSAGGAPCAKCATKAAERKAAALKELARFERTRARLLLR